MNDTETRQCLRQIINDGDYDGVEWVASELEQRGLIREHCECWEVTTEGVRLLQTEPTTEELGL